jgi:selenocysteine lyase/cysteine desulfurase
VRSSACPDPLDSQPEALDQLRAAEFSRLDRTGHIYLDYTGASLHGDSQLDAHLQLLRDHTYGNPHSANPASLAITSLVEAARRQILDYFHAAEHYHLVFTPNATGALKLIGEAFPFAPGSRYLLSWDNHNSVNGIREFARRKGAQIMYTPLTSPDLRLDLSQLSFQNPDPRSPHLFAFPAQSNYSGVQHPLSLIPQAQAQGWRVLLDAAAYVPTNPLNLSEHQPDFVSVSFYKMFGYPTGLGALLIHRNALPLLERPWFAGGTVDFTTVQHQHHLLSQGEAAFEDGTINYLSIAALPAGFALLTRAHQAGLRQRLKLLGESFLHQILSLRHANGAPFVRLHGPASMQDRGATFTFNLYDPAGLRHDYRRIEELAAQANISLRTGCFCNPGANEAAEGLTSDDISAGLALGSQLNLPNFVRLMDSRGIPRSAGAIRVSLGLASNLADLNAFFAFLTPLLNQPRHSLGEVTVSDDTCRVIRDSA